VVDTIVNWRGNTDTPTRYTILDEADEMLQPGWTEEIEKIMAGGGMSLVERVCQVH